MSEWTGREYAAGVKMDVTEQLLQLFAAHKALAFGLLGWYVLSAISSALPSPDSVYPEPCRKKLFYSFAYGFLHAFCGSVGRLTSKLRISWGNGNNKQQAKKENSSNAPQ